MAPQHLNMHPRTHPRFRAQTTHATTHIHSCPVSRGLFRPFLRANYKHKYALPSTRRSIRTLNSLTAASSRLFLSKL